MKLTGSRGARQNLRGLLLAALLASIIAWISVGLPEEEPKPIARPAPKSIPLAAVSFTNLPSANRSDGMSFRLLRLAEDQTGVSGVFQFRHSGAQDLKLDGFGPPGDDNSFNPRFVQYEIESTPSVWRNLEVGYCGTGAETWTLSPETEFSLQIALWPILNKALGQAARVVVNGLASDPFILRLNAGGTIITLVPTNEQPIITFSVFPRLLFLSNSRQEVFADGRLVTTTNAAVPSSSTKHVSNVSTRLLNRTNFAAGVARLKLICSQLETNSTIYGRTIVDAPYFQIDIDCGGKVSLITAHPYFERVPNGETKEFLEFRRKWDQAKAAFDKMIAE